MELTGSIGKFSTIDGGGANLDINLDAATMFYRELTIKKEDIPSNRYNLYSFVPVGRDGKAKLIGLTTPRHLLQGRKNCKTWNPKGAAYTTTDRVETMGIEYNGEQCGDAFAADCFEKLLAVGPDKYDLEATPESREVLSMLVEGVYTGLHNSFHDLVWFSRHPQITTADSGGSYNTDVVTDQEWADFKDQMFAEDQEGKQIKGLTTLIDEEKAAGTTHFNQSFVDGDFSDSTGAYTGSDITAEFDACIRAAHPNFKPIVRRRRGNVGSSFLVSLSVYDAYKNHLIATYGGIPEGYYLRVDGEMVPGVLFYDGIPVIAMDEWEAMDDMLGIRTHRIFLTAVGNLGITHSVDPIDQMGGLGMRIQKSPLLKDKGRIDMYSTFRLGTFIADTTLAVNKSLVETPA